MKYKYPYIADKKLYAAVMLACKMIRDSGWFHKVVSYCADKYNVPEEDIEKEIRKRQAIGQKGKKRVPFKYYVVCVHMKNDGGDSYEVYKATNFANARESASFHWNRNHYDEGMYQVCEMLEFNTKAEADTNCKRILDEYRKEREEAKPIMSLWEMRLSFQRHIEESGGGINEPRF